MRYISVFAAALATLVTSLPTHDSNGHELVGQVKSDDDKYKGNLYINGGCSGYYFESPGDAFNKAVISYPEGVRCRFYR